ncbi:MAG: hypothetical protein K0S08_1584 [Gammaproteobacteria bacterium]|jgi:hypothetical protein|nr:hypothetical protein [Gammaproteobacteria bacterium]
MKIKNMAFLLTALASTQLMGCASIVGGVNQPISVTTTPIDGAKCSLENDKGKWYVNQTPGSVVVHRSYKDLDVKCHKDGYQDAETKVVSKTKPMAAGNILFGGAVGVGLDVVDGAAYDYPNEVKVAMNKSDMSGAA